MGAILQQPPMYSAVSIKGERLYKAARRGGFILTLGHLRACLIMHTRTARFLLSLDDIHSHLQGMGAKHSEARSCVGTWTNQTSTRLEMSGPLLTCVK